MDIFIILGLLLLAAGIWLRDTSWMSSADDTLPILIALPLFFWLGMPWKFRKNSLPFDFKWKIIAIILFVAGVALNLTLLLALGWTALLWAWLSVRLEPEAKSSVIKLLVLPIMAFPWIAMDADRLGWWFRISGAWTTADVFSMLGYNVKQEGTQLLINNLPVSVEVACAGLNTLQSMIIAGTAADYIILGNSPRYWWNIPMLFGMAWVANTVRIIVLCIFALAVSPEFAMSSFHTWGGWLVIFLMFSFCWFILSLQETKTYKNSVPP